LTGESFDKAYMQHMVTAHQQAVTLFERETKTGKDADAKARATKTLPAAGIFGETLAAAQYARARSSGGGP
jgi:putative membrane protein